MKTLRLLSCLFAGCVTVSYAQKAESPHDGIEVQPVQDEVLIYVKPLAQAGAAHTDEVVISLIDRDYTFEEFAQHVREHMSNNTSVCIYAAPEVSWGPLTRVIECCSNAGVSRLRLKKLQPEPTRNVAAPEPFIP